MAVLVVGVHMGVVVVSTVVANTCVANTVSALAVVLVVMVVVVESRLVTAGCNTNVSVTVLTVEMSRNEVLTVVGVLEVDVKTKVVVVNNKTSLVRVFVLVRSTVTVVSVVPDSLQVMVEKSKEVDTPDVIVDVI